MTGDLPLRSELTHFFCPQIRRAAVSFGRPPPIPSFSAWEGGWLCSKMSLTYAFSPYVHMIEISLFFLFFLFPVLPFFADCFLLNRSLLHCRITRDRVCCRKKSRKEGDEEGIEGKKEGGKLTLLTRDLGTLLYLLSLFLPPHPLQSLPRVP